MAANLRPARSGRIIRPTKKASGKAFATTIDTIDVQDAFINVPLKEMEPPPIKPHHQISPQMLFPGDTNFTFRPQWHEQYTFTTDKGRQLRQDLAPLPKH